MSTIKERMYQQIEQHGANLNRIFNTGLDNVTLCKKLRRLEAKAHKLATDYCNGENGVDSENWDAKCRPILASVRKILGIKNKYPSSPDDPYPVFVNGDARGYALKLQETWMTERCIKLYKDWGGYGILAPEFDGN